MILVFLILFSAVLAMTIYVSHRLSGKRFAVTLNKKSYDSGVTNLRLHNLVLLRLGL